MKVSTQIKAGQVALPMYSSFKKRTKTGMAI